MFAFLVNLFIVKEMKLTKMQGLNGSKKFQSMPFYS